MSVSPIGRISVILGDITLQEVDAVVNAASPSLSGGGGVDGAIHSAAGPELLEECRALGGCRTGEAKITKGYRLPARFVIHTVGPVWQGGQQDEDKLLAACYRNSLALADANGVKTIAFPAISTSAYGFPLARATLIAVKNVLGYLSGSSGIEKVVFVCHNETAYRMYLDALGEVAGSIADGADGKSSRERAGDVRPETSKPARDIRDQVMGQVQMIEAVHDIRFVNRELLVDAITRAAGDRMRASVATAALNGWVATNNFHHEMIEIPDEILATILLKIKDR